jgi:tetratricopeptide (TPR) repeat protein
MEKEKFNDIFDKAIATNSNDTFAFSDTVSARLKLWMTLGSYTESVESFDKAISIKPDYAEAWYFRGLALLKLRRGEDAPDNFEMTRNGKKIVLVKRKWDSEAVESFDKAISIKPDYAEAWYYRGGALGNLNRFSEAVVSIDRAIAIKPDYPEAKQLREIAFQRKG